MFFKATKASHKGFRRVSNGKQVQNIHVKDIVNGGDGLVEAAMLP